MKIDLAKLSVQELKDLVTKANDQIVENAEENRRKLREEFAQRAAAHGFTLEEVVGGTRRARGGKGSRGPVKPKYRNPANPEQTWSGRGKRPNWFKDALASGKSEKDLAI